MPSAIINKLPTKLFLNGLLGLCIFLALMVSSCNERKSDPLECSSAFKPIYDSTNRLLELNEVDKGLAYLDSSIQHINPSTTDRFRYYSFHYVVNNRVKHNTAVALKYADSMLYVIESSDDKNRYLPFYAEANFARGDVLFEMGRYNESFSNYYQGYLTGKNSLNTCTLSDYTYRMGMIAYKQGSYKFAVNYFKQSFEQCQSCKVEFVSFYRQQEVLDNIALSYKNSGSPDSALIYFNKTVQYINDRAKLYPTRSEILKVARAVVEGNMAELLMAKGQYTRAMLLLKKSIAVNLRKGNDNTDAVLSELKLGQIYLKLNQEDLLTNLLQDMRMQLDTIKSSDAEAGWNELMGDYYRNKNDLISAFPYLETYHHIKDSLSKINRTLQGNNVSEQISNLEKQYQIVALRNKQRIYIYTGLVFLCMSFIIMLLVYRNSKRSRAEMAIVSALNKQVNHQKDELENTLFDLENSSQEKDRILRTVAHDLRNPLGGIASLITTMIEDREFSSEQIELLKIIKETAFDSLELINEILEATDHTPTQLHKQPVDINLLLINSVELMRFKAAEKNQKITLQPLKSAELLLISREKIWRVISNLVSNAIKFSPVGAEIKVSITDEGSDIQISVSDNGIGIPDSIKNKVFNMFTDAKRPGTLGEKSFGLGLSICRQIIEKHHGKIWFESNKQNGTTFYVRLSKTNIPVRDVVPV